MEDERGTMENTKITYFMSFVFSWLSHLALKFILLFILVDINPADENLPEHVPYILIGAGTASFAACRAIKKEKPDAKVDWKIHFQFISLFHECSFLTMISLKKNYLK